MTLSHTRGLLEFSILATLEKTGPARASEVHRMLCARTGRKMSHTNVPTTLVRMAEKGLVQASIVPWGEREYAVYSLARVGRVALTEARKFLRPFVA